MRRRRRTRFSEEATDPLDSLANLFELAMVLAVAVLTMIAVRFNMVEMFSNRDFTMVKNPGQADMEIVQKRGPEIVRYKAAATTEAGSSAGKWVGVAYQLPSGEVIYVPDK